MQVIKNPYFFRGPFGPRRLTGMEKEHFRPRLEHLRQGRLDALWMGDCVDPAANSLAGFRSEKVLSPRESVDWHRTFLTRQASQA
jgi:hypothetical protein